MASLIKAGLLSIMWALLLAPGRGQPHCESSVPSGSGTAVSSSELLVLGREEVEGSTYGWWMVAVALLTLVFHVKHVEY